ncbi:MAG: HAD-IIB family hydrolase [Atopobiaceae bacterium]|nr:HAD-IIB family hydrolase [Atopobiaceae bacterium]
MTNVLFIDVDGTLVTAKDGKQYIPPSALDGLAEVRRRGGRCYLCTGRSLAEARSIGDVPIDGIIGAAGGFVLDGQTMVFHRRLAETDVLAVETWLRDHGFAYYLESNAGLFFDEAYMAHARVAWGFDGNPALTAIVHSVEEANRTDVNKISFRTEGSTTFAQVAEAFGERFYLVQSSFDKPDVCAGELSLPGINKATAIDELLAYLNLDEVRTFGFGDSMNDIEMLDRCDEAIVMGDARHAETLAHATYVTKPVLEDGIAHALRHFGLIS